MIKLTKLFQSVEKFYRQAINAYSIAKYSAPAYTMPDTEEENVSGINNDQYAELVGAAQKVKDPDLSSELLLLAEMYKKAVDLGSGYNSINRAISNIINMYLDDEDDPDQSAVEDLLNDVTKDLRTRAGGAAALNKPDSPETIAQLKQLKNEFNDRAVEDEMNDLSQFDDKAISVFDPTGGMGWDEAQKGSGRGFSVTPIIKPLKDWIKHYRNEQQRYIDSFSQSSSPILKPKITKILEVLTQLISKLSQANNLKKELVGVPDPDKDVSLQNLMEEIKKLKIERNKLKASLKKDLLDMENNKLLSELTSSTDNRSKFLLQQQIELNKTLASSDKNKGEEVRLRKMLITSMSGGNTLGQQTLQDLINKIEKAKLQKKSIEEFNKEQAAQIGSIKKLRYNESAAAQDKLRGEIIFYGQNVNTQRRELKVKLFPAIKTKVYTKLANEETTIFKPYIDAINEAVKNNDEARKKQLTKELNALLSKRADADPLVILYNEKAAKLQSYEGKLLSVSNSKSELDIQLVQQLINDGNNLKKELEEKNIISEKYRNIFSPITKNIENMTKLLNDWITK